MRTKLLFIVFLTLLIGRAHGQGQVQQAYLDHHGQVLVGHPGNNAGLFSGPENDRQQVSPWPKKIAANPSFKNFRGVTLADIDGDGAEEILVASHNRLHVFKGTGELVWSIQLTGIATYPPSVADVTGNGSLELVQLTGGIPNNGRAYLIDAATGTIHDGWPLSFNNQWILSAPTLADLDGSGQMEIIFGVRTLNELHVVKADGLPLNDNWPVVLASVPAFTPSVGDLNNNGQLNIIAAASNGTLYAFDLDGENLPGFPVQADATGFSYQSPLLVDFDSNGYLDIVGANHGDSPQFFIRDYTGEYRYGWPKPIPGWTYSPPTVVDLYSDQEHQVFMGIPISDVAEPMLFGYTPHGDQLPNFPFEKPGGLEGFISVADIDGDGNHELIFGSNLMVDGKGFIHVWKTDGSGEMPGFPLRPDGFTFMNGANLGDVTGDGMLNLVALSYEQTFSATDSTIINVYDLGISVQNADVKFGTYKGSNTRDGLIPSEEPPGPVWDFFRIVNASHHLGQIDIFMGDHLLLEDFGTGMASDTIRVHVYQPFTLNVAHSQTGEILLSETFTMELVSEVEGWLIVLAGETGEGANEDHEAGFFVYESMRAGYVENGMIDVLIFGAYIDPENQIDYQFINLPEDEPLIEFGEFAGYFSMPWMESEFGVSMFETATGDFIHTNFFEMSDYHSFGSAAHFVILDMWPEEPSEPQAHPFLLLIPENEGMLIAPEVTTVNTGTPDIAQIINLFPNPASGSFNISFEAFKPGNISIRVADISGRVIIEVNELIVSPGYYETSVSTPNIRPGVYIVQIAHEGISKSLPLIIKP